MRLLFVYFENARSISVTLAALQRRNTVCVWIHAIFNIDVYALVV